MRAVAEKEFGWKEYESPSALKGLLPDFSKQKQNKQKLLEIKDFALKCRLCFYFENQTHFIIFILFFIFLSLYLVT